MSRHPEIEVIATAPVVAVVNGDASLDLRQLDRVTGPVVDGDADLVLGRRQRVCGAFPWLLLLANRALAARIGRQTAVRLHDVGPVRAARSEFLLSLDLRGRRSGCPGETVVRAADAGARITEVPVHHLLRRGRSEVTMTPLSAWHAVRDVSAATRR